MTGPTCGGCVHCGETELNAELKREYECRANPPTVAFIPTQHGVAKFTGYPGIQKLTPACGLYEPLPPARIKQQ